MSNEDTNIFIFSAEESEHHFGSDNMTQDIHDVPDLANLVENAANTPPQSPSGASAAQSMEEHPSLRDAPPLSTPRESLVINQLINDIENDLNVLLEDSNHDSPMSIVTESTASSESTESTGSTETTESFTDSSNDSSTETILLSESQRREQNQAIDLLNQILANGDPLNPNRTSIPVQTTTVETQTDQVKQCTVCYKSLTIENSVSTMCNHFFCKKCFYRWIEINATCPSCRTPINSKTNLTDEQLAREQQEIYATYQDTLILNCIYSKKNMKLVEQRNYLEKQNDDAMRTSILVRKKIAYNRGFNDGILAARDKFQGGKGKKNPRWVGRFADNEWSHGFNIGYYNTKYDLAFKHSQYIKSKKQSKHKRSKNLFKYGFTKNKRKASIPNVSSQFENIKIDCDIIKDFPEQVEHHATERATSPRRRRVRVPDQRRIDRKRDRIRRERMASRSVGPRGPNNYIGGESM